MQNSMKKQNAKKSSVLLVLKIKGKMYICVQSSSEKTFLFIFVHPFTCCDGVWWSACQNVESNTDWASEQTGYI